MKAPLVLLGGALLLVGLMFIAIQMGINNSTGIVAGGTFGLASLIGAPLLIAGFAILTIGLLTSEPASRGMTSRSGPAEAPPDGPSYLPPPPRTDTAQPGEGVTRDVIAKGVVRVRCGNCGSLADVGMSSCPICFAPI